MISGFNTDIEHDGVVYHVQTEDKGVKTPFVLSLVYKGGTILASKRSPYEDLIEAGFDETELEIRVQRQHKLMCAAITAGRIEDLKRMTMNRSAKKPDGLVAKKQEVVVIPEKTSAPLVEVSPDAPIMPESDLPATTDVPAEPVVHETTEEDELDPKATDLSGDQPDDTPPDEPAEPPVETPPDSPSIDSQTEQEEVSETPEEKIWDVPMIEDVEIVEADPQAIKIIEEEIILPPEAVKVIDDFNAFESLMDDELKVKIMGTEEFQSGERKNVNVLVCRGKKETAVAGAGIMIKVLGSDFRPQIFHAIADDNGVATVSVSIPEFRSGRAAVLVRAMIGNEEAEIRRAIKQ